MSVDKPTSIFDNDQFVNGFIDFYGSVQFEKYMIPFLSELIEDYRDKLESSSEPCKIQNKLSAVRTIASKAEMLKLEKAMKAKEVSDL